MRYLPRTWPALRQMKAMMNTEVAVSRVGIMITPNQPKYRRLLVDVMNDANLSQGESERSERSQIEDVTNYSSNVAQGFDEPRSSYSIVDEGRAQRPYSLSAKRQRYRDSAHGEYIHRYRQTSNVSIPREPRPHR